MRAVPVREENGGTASRLISGVGNMSCIGEMENFMDLYAFILETYHLILPNNRHKGTRTAWIDNIKTWTGLPVEESIRMT